MSKLSFINDLQAFFEKNDARKMTSTLFSVAVRDAAENPALYKETETSSDLESVVELVLFTSMNSSRDTYSNEYPEKEFKTYMDLVISHLTNSTDISPDKKTQQQFIEIIREMRAVEQKLRDFLTQTKQS